MKLEQTFNHFLLEHQQQHSRTLNFLTLMEAIITSTRYIESYYTSAALENQLFSLDIDNIQGETVMKVDQVANQIIMHYLEQSGQVLEVTTEESEEPIKMNPDGRYIVYFDPLDGSSNIKHALPVGFMFGVAKRNLEGEEDFHLRSGKDFICAGVFNIPLGIFTFSLRNSGTWRFFQHRTGVYVRPQRIFLPEDPANWELSYNAGHRDYYSKKVNNWIEKNSNKYSFRYSGAMATDLLRLLGNGGMFFYPGITNSNKKDYPNGKLRLMYECAVAAFMINEAGGVAMNENGENILDLKPTDRHERSSIFMGNKKVLADFFS